jgi:NTE family protein
MNTRRSTLSLVLGGGGARGLAHIGIIKCLEENRIPIHSVVGTSIGAFIGGLYATGITASAMEEIVRTMDRLAVARILMPGFSASAIINKTRVRRFVTGLVGDKRIEKLPITFRAVSTDLVTGEEVVFDKGPLVDAILASTAFPAIFQPVYNHGRYLVDGGLCNPLPLSVAHQLHAHHVVAVNVSPNPERLRKRIQKKTSQKDARLRNTLPAWLSRLQRARDNTRAIDVFKIPTLRGNSRHGVYFPTVLRVTLQSISIGAHNLISQHLRQFPPDILIAPRIEEYDMLEFYRGAEIIQCGYDAAAAALPEIQALT